MCFCCRHRDDILGLEPRPHVHCDSLLVVCVVHGGDLDVGMAKELAGGVDAALLTIVEAAAGNKFADLDWYVTSIPRSR